MAEAVGLPSPCFRWLDEDGALVALQYRHRQRAVLHHEASEAPH